MKRIVFYSEHVIRRKQKLIGENKTTKFEKCITTKAALYLSLQMRHRRPKQYHNSSAFRLHIFFATQTLQLLLRFNTRLAIANYILPLVVENLCSLFGPPPDFF